MITITTETFAKNCVYTIKVNKKADKKYSLWIRMIDIQKGLDVENIYDLVRKEIHGRCETNNPTEQQTRKYKRHGSEWLKDDKYMYAHEGIITPIIIGCKAATPKSIEFRSNLGLDQKKILLTKEQSVLISIMDPFEEENMQTQYSVLGYRIEFHFHDYKPVIEVDKKGHKDRNINHEIERKKAIEKELGCEFIRINPDKEGFNIFKAVNEILRHIKKSSKESTKESTKKSLIDNLSKRLLELV